VSLTVAILLLVAFPAEDLVSLAEKGDFEGLKQKVAQGVPVDSPGRFGIRPLHEAARAGHEVITIWLLDQGAELEGRDFYGWSAAMLAASEGHLSLVQALHGRGADFATGDKQGITPLMWATTNAHLEVVRYLVETVGVDLKARDQLGRDAFAFARKVDTPEIYNYLAQKVGPGRAGNWQPAGTVATEVGTRILDEDELIAWMEAGKLSDEAIAMVDEALAAGKPLPRIRVSVGNPDAPSFSGVLSEAQIREKLAAGELPPELADEIRDKLAKGEPLPRLRVQTTREPVAAAPKPKVAQPATLVYLDSGEPVDFTDYRGEVLLLDFWATWCKPCHASIPDLKRISRLTDKKPFRVISVSVDREAETARRFTRKEKMTWTQVLDPRAGGISKEVFGVRGYPTFMIIDHEGNAIYRESGYSAQRMADIRMKVNRAIRKAVRARKDAAAEP